MKVRFFSIALLLMLALITAACGTNEKTVVDDTAITAAVKTDLASDVALKSIATIEVNTTNGVVTLAGQVPSAQEKSAAEKVVRSVNGVKDVKNNLQVQTK